MKSLGKLFGQVLKFIKSGKVASAGFFAWASSNFLTFFVGFQLIAWILSAIFTILLAFFATDMVSGIFDMLGFSDMLSSVLTPIANIGGQFDSLTSLSAFNGSFSDAITFFSLEKFLNFLASFWFGVLSLKINIFIFRMSQFRASKNSSSLTTLLGGYKGPTT